MVSHGWSVRERASGVAGKRDVSGPPDGQVIWELSGAALQVLAGDVGDDAALLIAAAVAAPGGEAGGYIM